MSQSLALRRFESNVTGIFYLLVIQFLIGIFVNLFVKIPAVHTGQNPSNYFSGVIQVLIWVLGNGPLLVRIHVLIALLLFVLGTSLIFRVGALHVPGTRFWTFFGWFGIWGAGFNGASFLIFNEDFSSMFMALGFAFALLSYGMLMPKLAVSVAKDSGGLTA